MIIRFEKEIKDSEVKLLVENIKNQDLILEIKDFNNFTSKLNYHKLTRNMKIGASELFFQNYRNTITYDNMKATIQSKSSKWFLIFKHLRTNNEIELEFKDGYIVLPWCLIYNEIIRINAREQNNNRKELLKKQATQFKILDLHAKLEQNGIEGFEHEDERLIQRCGYYSIYVSINKKDRTTDMIVNNYRFELRRLSYDIIFDDISFDTLVNKIKYAKLFMEG